MRNLAILAGAFAMTATASPMPQLSLGGCKEVTFVFARGSTEPGSMGLIVGPAFSSALGSLFRGSIETYGVNYPASIAGAVSGAVNPGGAEGAKDMTRKVKEIMQKCPNSKIVLGGYSQGAEQVHGALSRENLGADGAKIAAAVVYGDPMAGELTKMFGGWGCLPVERTKVFCNQGDGVCTGAFSISAAHLSYTSNGDVNKGAQFAAKWVKEGNLGGGKCSYGFGLSSGGGASTPATAAASPAKGTAAAPPAKGTAAAPTAKATGATKGAGGSTRGSLFGGSG